MVTNYHVVSSVVMEPDIYALEYLRSDGSTGALQIVALDVRNDLALLRIKGTGFPSLSLQKTPLDKGDRGYAIGNPLSVGMTIVEGTYNGLVSTKYNDLFHFTGAINPGMSGGPTVTEGGTVFGVNVAFNSGGQMVGYVVPVHFISALQEKAGKTQHKPLSQLRAEVNAQLLAYQDELANKLLEKPFAVHAVGRGYRAPDKLADFFECGGSMESSSDMDYTINSSFCLGNSALTFTNVLTSGYVYFVQRLVEVDHWGLTNFAYLYRSTFRPRNPGEDSLQKEVSRYACNEDMVTSGNSKMRVILCERQYRKFDGLYDIQLKIATLNESNAGLQSTALFNGFSHENGMRLAKRYLESLSWKP